MNNKPVAIVMFWRASNAFSLLDENANEITKGTIGHCQQTAFRRGLQVVDKRERSARTILDKLEKNFVR